MRQCVAADGTVMTELLRLLRLFRPYLGWMLLGVFLSFVTLLANVGLMAISGWFIAAMALAGLAGVTMNYFTPAAMIRFFAIIRTAGRYGERLVTHEATFRLLSELRHWFYLHLEPLAPAGLTAFRSGDLLNRIQADIDSLQNFYLRIFTPLLVAMLALPVFVVFLALYSPALALLEFVMLCIGGVLLPVLSERLAREPGRGINASTAELRSVVIEACQGMDELLVYGRGQWMHDEVHQLGARLGKFQAAQAGVSGLGQAGILLIAHLTLWLVLLIALPQVQEANLPPAHLAMLSLFTLASFEAITPLPAAFQSLGETLAAAGRVFRIIDTRPLVEEPVEPLAAPRNGNLEFRDVSFAYPEADTLALEHVSFDCPQGKKIAVVGVTGSGKSTILNLLQRFWSVDSGAILVDGHPVSDYRGEDLRHCFAQASQHAHLFNTTIRDNLKLASPEATDDQLEAACRIAGIHDEIIRQPQGYATYVGEAGLKLSGGQRRRLSIARAILKDAPILLLDEPGESLDRVTEHRLLTALLQHCHDRSLIMVTHSYTLLDQMDEILLLENGRVVVQGSYEQVSRHQRFQAISKVF
jgi:ATP-binding cassette subfamily C protein CydC